MTWRYQFAWWVLRRAGVVLGLDLHAELTDRAHGRPVVVVLGSSEGLALDFVTQWQCDRRKASVLIASAASTQDWCMPSFQGCRPIPRE